MVVVDVINVYKKLKGECKRNATRFISVMPRTRVNKHKVKHRMFPLLTNTFFFYCEGHGTLEQVVQGVCGLHTWRYSKIV